MKTLENSLGEVNVRLTDDERQVAELQAGKAKSQKELEALVSQLEEAESHASTLERQNKAFTLQVQEVQVSTLHDVRRITESSQVTSGEIVHAL